MNDRFFNISTPHYDYPKTKNLGIYLSIEILKNLLYVYLPNKLRNQEKRSREQGVLS